MILFYVFKNVCNSLDDNYLCIFSCIVQVPSNFKQYLGFRKAFKRVKFKSKQHQNPSREKPVFKISPKFNSHLIKKQLNSPYSEWGFKKEQAEKQEENCNMCK